MILKNIVSIASGKLSAEGMPFVVYYDKECTILLPAGTFVMVFVLEGRVGLHAGEEQTSLGEHYFFISDGAENLSVAMAIGARAVLVIDTIQGHFFASAGKDGDIVTRRKMLVTPQFRTFLFKIEKAVESSFDDNEWLQQELHLLPVAMDSLLHTAIAQMNKIPASKISTRKVLYRQLCFARDFMDEHFAQNPSIGDIAREANLSEFHFSRLFKKVFSKSPYQYMTEQRASNAFEILTTNTPIGVINLSVGLDSHHSFSAFCKANMGLSPTEVRQAYRFMMAKLAGLNKQDGD